MAEQKQSGHSSLPAISEVESLLRRVPPSFYPDSKVSDKPAFDAFLPRRWKSEEDPGDSTGLSVNREWFITLEDASRHPQTGMRQNVARTSVQQLRTLQLSVIPDERPGDRSHALIPELNSRDYKNDRAKKIWIKTTARRIALEFCEMAFVCPASTTPPKS